MRPYIFTICLTLSAFQLQPCFADDEAVGPKPLPIERLTRERAAQVLANTDGLAEDLTRQIKNLRNPAEAAAVDDLHGALAGASEWEWYSRDHGILLAIPVKERLGISSSYTGEKVLADVVRRLINQKGWGNPPVQVVLVEPELPALAHPPVKQDALRPFCAPAGVSCACTCP